jgi:hypothetical protein
MLWRISEFVRNIFSKKRVEQELDEEIRSYLELTAAEKARGGMSPEAAIQSARRDLGGMEQVKENVRDIRNGVFLDTLTQDLHYALRTLTKNRSFAAIAILTLALAIGCSCFGRHIFPTAVWMALRQPISMTGASKAAPSTRWRLLIRIPISF